MSSVPTKSNLPSPISILNGMPNRIFSRINKYAIAQILAAYTGTPNAGSNSFGTANSLGGFGHAPPCFS
jgi:hypothetical protein